MKKNNKIIIGIITTIILIIVAFTTYETATWNKEYYISEKNLEIPIFLYHDIVENKEQIEYDYMQTDKETFEKQINGLLKLGYKVISYEDLVKYKNGKIPINKHTCLIDFDDGYEGNYKIALDIIKKYNIPVSIYVIDNCVGKEGYMSWEQIKELDETGLVTINTHGKEHYNFDQKETNEAVQDVEYAHSQIEEHLGKKQIKVFTYPCGLTKEETRKELENAGFIQNLTDNKINKSKELNLYGLHRCYALEDNIWKMMLKVKYRSIRYD